MNALRSLAAALDTGEKTHQTSPAIKKTEEPLPSGKQPVVTEHDDGVLARGATSVADIEKLMGELATARDYLKAEGERLRRENARYAHLTSTASASVKIIAESMGKWRASETNAPA
jgi:hypothetical protein